MIRISAGRLRGRRLKVPDLPGLRPTSAKLREAVFDILNARLALAGTSFLDLFAGSGAVGIEALSRGAGHAEFVEADGRAAAALRATLAELGLGESATVTCDTRPRGREFAAIFADPPYALIAGHRVAQFDLAPAVAALAPAGFLILESGRREPPEVPGLSLVRAYDYGHKHLFLFHRTDA